ncbi:lysylphosphatidylglycerol synthase transmembrane domain-containing protein [Cesiribacter sp. SM1]|uniref:lysylphosphatidylglycerol synthase transmembrane domain-containing protein n=1 Tax=Cesiribacter sp. SM1 TaxID=2861196 RepID=UPI001CD4634E|nr:lysylphosphatidylglycerol synthase transmembrane domain-containing protein [Cesiribacter sp. SM1]
MNVDTQKVLKTLNPRKVWIPVLLGIGIVVAMMLFDDNLTADKLLLISHAGGGSMLAALLIILCRDLGYIYRIRMLTGKQLSWMSSVYVIILWEFSSAVTPSVVGGTAVAIFILYKEGIKLGQSIAYAMLSAILDNMFFVVAAPIALFLSGGQAFPRLEAANLQFGGSLEVLFYISYGLITVYTLVMGLALFSKPRAFKWLLIKLTSIGFLRRWRHGAVNRGNEIIMASRQLKGRGWEYWVKISVATLFVWIARYFTLNAVISAFADMTVSQHLLIFGRQIVMWITMLISPTPGSSGFAEGLFPQFFSVFLGDYTLIANILWRMVTYYPYLILGALVLPRWLQRAFLTKKPVEEA